ncbi:HlyD family secretion protein [Pseudoduganella flava]|nr:HlyD family type I secretion periplasmic adaptor subunit [Pseudoduganella flava]TWI42129.1 HlyD family secretion protein [Pseudoduganella flava]
MSRKRLGEATETEFLPDADAIERAPLPPYLRRTLHVLAAALLVFIVWASVSKIDVIVIAPGRLVNPTPNIVVQPLETSIVQRIAVRPGQVVRKGELLATLDPTFTQADEAQLRNRYKSLETQTRSLEAELSGRGDAATGGGADDRLQAQLASERKANFAAQRAKMSENIARLKAGIETNKRDQQVLAERLKSLSQIEAMQERLVAENFGAKMQLLEARDRRLEVERTLVMGRNKDVELSRELASAEAELAAFDKSWRQKAMEDLLNASRERDSLAEQLAKADMRHRLVQLTAPADGVVLEVPKLSTGSVVREAEQMFVIVPLGAQLEAEVQIESQDVGTLKVGAPVHVKLDAFPFQKHGMLEGKVRNISEDAFRREQVATGQGDAYYVGRIALSNVKLRNMAQARLLPGMTLNAEIVTGQRSVMSYLLWPLTKALDESLREP